MPKDKELRVKIIQLYHNCYDLRLSSGCNLGKDLREERGVDQLVKHKEYKIVSMLYILVVHKESIGNT